MAGMGIATADYLLAQGSSSSSENPNYQLYTVVPGDSLSIIAQKFLGDSSQWRQIWDANSSIEDPNVIEVGAVLEIPSSKVLSNSSAHVSVPSGPRMTAQSNIPDDGEDSSGSSLSDILSSPMFLAGAAGVALLIVIIATKKKVAS